MARIMITLVAGLALVGTGSASAQAGNGAYEPFPTPVPNSHAAGFYGAFGVHLSQRAVDRGAFLPGLTAARAGTGGPTLRAVGRGSPGSWVALAVVAIAAAGGLAVALGRRTTAAAHPR